MKPELKPCPFCGGRAYRVRTGTPKQSCIVECESCGCFLETGEEGDQCGTAWNRRAPAEPVNEHPDDAAVDAFATAMKAKLAKKRAEGRGGWQECDARYLSELLRGHVEKGDPVDVANLAMMLHQNSQLIHIAENHLRDATKMIEPVKVPSDDEGEL